MRRKSYQAMEMNLQNWKTLPLGDFEHSNAILQSEWEVPSRHAQLQSLESILATWRTYHTQHDSFKEPLSYSCFLDNGQQHIIHLSQWKDRHSIENFEKNDSPERVNELLKNTEVKRLGKQVYSPFATYKESASVDDTRLVVFVKQFFQQSGQAAEWIELILQTLRQEGEHAGLIQNTYFLNEDKTELLNYAFWMSESEYDDFLQHKNPATKDNWRKIKSFEGWLKSKGRVRKCNEFIRIQ